MSNSTKAHSTTSTPCYHEAFKECMASHSFLQHWGASGDSLQNDGEKKGQVLHDPAITTPNIACLEVSKTQIVIGHFLKYSK